MTGIRTILDVGRFALGVVAKTVATVSPLDHKYHLNERLDGPWPKGTYIWLHGASLGECKMLLDLAKFLRRDIPDCPKLLVTTQKIEVFPYLEDHGAGVVDVAMAPADSPMSMSKFVRNVQPIALILAENELWPGYLSTMSRTSLKPSVALVSGRFRRAFPGTDFSALGFACMQTQADRERIVAAAGRPKFNPGIGGDWKILPWALDDAASSAGAQSDRVAETSAKDVDVAMLSVHFAEWESLWEIVRNCKLRNKSVVLMPRRLEEVEIFRHELQQNNVKTVDWPQARPGAVTLINQFGLTSEILARSKQAVVGGSFCPKPGVHNFWEPIQAGVPTCVGPYSFGHEDMVEDLVREGVLAQLSSASDFENLDLVDENQAQACLSVQKLKVSDSYRQLLLFLKDLLK